jgi:hypothetical protein
MDDDALPGYDAVSCRSDRKTRLIDREQEGKDDQSPRFVEKLSIT